LVLVEFFTVFFLLYLSFLKSRFGNGFIAAIPAAGQIIPPVSDKDAIGVFFANRIVFDGFFHLHVQKISVDYRSDKTES